MCLLRYRQFSNENITMNKRLFAAAASFALLATSITGGAATTSDTLTVTATVVDSCSLSTSTLAFGNYDPASGTDTDATTTIDASCTTGTTFDIALDGGSSADINARTMSDGTNTLGYQIYTDTLRSTIWGDGTTGSTAGGTGLGPLTAVTLTAHGRIVAGQNVPPGAYSDTVNVTLTF